MEPSMAGGGTTSDRWSLVHAVCYYIEHNNDVFFLSFLSPNLLNPPCCKPFGFEQAPWNESGGDTLLPVACQKKIVFKVLFCFYNDYQDFKKFEFTNTHILHTLIRSQELHVEGAASAPSLTYIIFPDMWGRPDQLMVKKKILLLDEGYWLFIIVERSNNVFYCVDFLF